MITLLEGGTFFEGARWHDGAWWVADFYAHRVLRVTTDGEATSVAAVPGQPSGLGWLPDGRLLVVSMKDRRLLRQEATGRLVEHADLTTVTAGWANDMVVDAHGRAYVGNLGFDLFGDDTPAHTTIAMVTPDGQARVVADDLRFPNGTVITGDGRTLIVAESFGGVLTAFTIAPDGSLTDRRIVAGAAVIGLFLVTSIASGILVGGSGQGSIAALANVLALPLYLRDLVFLGHIDAISSLGGVGHGGLLAIGLYVLIVAVCVGVLLRRYRWVER